MNQRSKIIITDFINDDLAPERKVLDGIGSVEALDAYEEGDLVGRIEDADAIMIYHHFNLSHKTIDRLTQCKLIVRCGVGVDNVDHAFAREQGIAVANIPDYGTEEVADSAIGMTLALVRGVHYFNSRLRAQQGAWHYTQAAPLRRLRGRVFGVVGLGRIGMAASLRAKALGMDVVFYDPYKPDGYDKTLGIKRVESLEELLHQAYVLSIHCPSTSETHHMIGHAQISQMQVGSYLINTARGAVVDVSAVPDALASGHLAGVGLDVLEHEPPGDNHPLLLAWRDPNHPAHHRLLLNPHAAFYCEEGLMEMRVKGSKACRCAIKGLPVSNIVN